jgi:1-acyl-sn-glycerol-3-phosphate acyltransferase
MLPFWASIAALSLTQAITVALPGSQAILALRRRRQAGWLGSRWWALIPPGSVLLFVAVGSVAANASASFLTYFALCGVPIGAILALGWLMRGARPLLTLAVLPLIALAWADGQALPGQTAAVALTTLSCVALGALLAAVTPPRWLIAGIIAMAAVDVTLVASELLQKPNDALNLAHPAAKLPRLQAEIFGSAAMGYGDLFVAALLGGLLAATAAVGRQRQIAALVAVLALAFDLLFFLVDELPATVPVAVALIFMLIRERVRDRGVTAAAGRGSQVVISDPLDGGHAKAGDRTGSHRAIWADELKPQVYIDPRPAERFTRYHDWARSHRPDWVQDLLRLIMLPLSMVLYRASCRSSAGVPGAGPAILAPNHFSAMDHFFCGIYLRRRVRFMAKSQLFSGPLASILEHAGAFPVRRGQRDEQAIETALAILRKGGVIVIYPEGGRSRSASIGDRARPGVGRLALESGAPVIPVAIRGSQRVRGWKRLRFPRVRVAYGEPLRYSRLTGSSREQQQQVAEEVLGQVRDLYGTLSGAEPAPSGAHPPLLPGRATR